MVLERELAKLNSFDLFQVCFLTLIAMYVQVVSVVHVILIIILLNVSYYDTFVALIPVISVKVHVHEVKSTRL